MANNSKQPLLQTYPVPQSDRDEHTMSAKAYIYFTVLALISAGITLYFL